MNYQPSKSMVSFRDLWIIMWTLAGLCLLLTIGRYAIRYKVSMRLYRDDFVHLCAFFWLIVFAALTQASFPATQAILKSEVLHTPASSSTIVEFCRLQTAQGVSFYLLHWTVKIAFMLFYKELFWISRSFIRAWWCVLAFVLVGLAVALAGILTQRGPITKIADPHTCLAHNSYSIKARIYIFVANIVTDLAVMLLPINMLRKLPIRKTQKLGLVLVFSVCIFTIALEMFRFIKNILGDDSTNNVLYAIINANLTVIISCIPTYRSLWKLWRKARRGNSGSAASDSSTGASRQSVRQQKIASNFDWSDSITSRRKPAVPLRAFFQNRFVSPFARASREEELLSAPPRPVRPLRGLESTESWGRPPSYRP